jgi:hypothetical protein
MTDPKAKALGSTSVACWLEGLVKVSVLSLVSETGGIGIGGEVDRSPPPEPQPRRKTGTAIKKSDQKRHSE